MAEPKVRAIADYGRRIEILDGIYPAFADCSVNASPGGNLMAYVSRLYGLGMAEVERSSLGMADGLPGSLAGIGVYVFPNAATDKPPAPPQALALRDYFQDAGVLICRPGESSSIRFGVALKGGHNAEHHNHNDVGSYLLSVSGGAPPSGPRRRGLHGAAHSARNATTATCSTRSGTRCLACPASCSARRRQAAAKVLRTEFTDQRDTIVLDLTAAYDVKGLQQLHARSSTTAKRQA